MEAKITSTQCKMARAGLGLGVRDLAQLAQVSTNTVTRLERGEELKPRTVEALKSALEDVGVIFVPENGAGPGVRLENDRERLKEVLERLAQRVKFELPARGPNEADLIRLETLAKVFHECQTDPAANEKLFQVQEVLSRINAPVASGNQSRSELAEQLWSATLRFTAIN